MNESTIMLVPSPGAKPEFLAKVVPSENIKNKDLPLEIVLSRYTREQWAISPGTRWKSISLNSIDGRDKISGFLNYLKERKKAAVATLEFVGDDTKKRGLFVVPPPNSNAKNDILICKYVLDENILKNPPPQSSTRMEKIASSGRNNTSLSCETIKIGAKGGLLGNLLVSRKKTNAHLASVSKSSLSKTAKNNKSKQEEGSEVEKGETSGDVIAKFRSTTFEAFEAFDLDSSEDKMIFPINLKKITENMNSEEEKLKVTIDVLKFIVFEQVEEIGDFNWVAVQEPNEFVDDVNIAVYKEGHAPAEVMEEYLKGDTPEGAKEQDNAKKEAARQSAALKKGNEEKKRLLHEQMILAKSSDNTEQLIELNTKKRDRRSIAEIQRDIAEEKSKKKGTDKRPRHA